MTHTPGPWVQFDDKESPREITIMPAGRVGSITTVRQSDGQTNEEFEANANIINAAPDLLAALKAISEFWAYGLNKPKGARPTVEDHARAEQLGEMAAKCDK